MEMRKLYSMQEELDSIIMENRVERTGLIMEREERFQKTKLALFVELGELANTTRDFKHWSTKGKMNDDIIIDELADCWHFYLSLGNQLDMHMATYANYSQQENKDITSILNKIFINLAYLESLASEKDMNGFWYGNIGQLLYQLAAALGFDAKQVQTAYLNKHDENYVRQRSGY